jgi:signal transduction histidine kinase
MLWNFILYLLYGLTFFTLGVAILSRDIRLSELGIAKILWLLATFGIVHGFHEWLELLELLFPEIVDSRFTLFRLVIVSLSFLFLFYFGLFLNIITLRGDQALRTIPRVIKALVGAMALSVILFAAYLDLGSTGNINTRLLVAFPGGMLSGVGLILYSRTVRPFSGNVATHFILAGSCMICYAVLTGTIPSDVVVPLLGVKVILLRGLSAFLIMFFTIRALSVFNLEQRELVNEKLLRFSQSEKLTSMGILAAGIAHEINNPLTNISLNVELLKDLVGNDEKIGRKIEAIDRNIDRASRIAKELLHFSREKETALVPIDLNRIIASVNNLLTSQPRSTIIHLDLRDIPTINGIPWKLEEVFINLLMNSLDACSAESHIQVSTFRHDDQVLATIADNGHGIKEEHLGQVFDPFFTTKEIGKGTGLGLSVCYNIISQHGGTLALTSREGDGTVVTLTFPVTSDDNRKHNGD